MKRVKYDCKCVDSDYTPFIKNKARVFLPVPLNSIEPVFAQIDDGNLSFELTKPGPIQLQSDSDIFEHGGFTLTSTQITNDTLNFPDVGVYKMDINLKYYFIPHKEFGTLGNFYQVVIGIVGVNIGQFIPELVINTGIPTIASDVVGQTLSNTIILNITETNAAIWLNLKSFNFKLSFKNKINIYSTTINVVKLLDRPLTW
ncbi:hypothetical protein PV797_12500 [Clostridiaceae bacterium M8S5]|nr:hypothetical protein PV797_12500 [Clostridiaceae bacterium M8S5]